MERWSEDWYTMEGFYGKEGRAKKFESAKGKDGLFQAWTPFFFVKKGFYQADDFTRAD